MAHGSTLALELSIALERRAAYSIIAQRVHEAMSRGGLVESRTAAQTGFRVEPALDEPNERLVVTWHDAGLETEEPMLRARHRQALERILWLIADEVEDIRVRPAPRRPAWRTKDAGTGISFALRSAVRPLSATERTIYATALPVRSSLTD